MSDQLPLVERRVPRPPSWPVSIATPSEAQVARAVDVLAEHMPGTSAEVRDRLVRDLLDVLAPPAPARESVRVPVPEDLAGPDGRMDFGRLRDAAGLPRKARHDG